MIKGHADGMEFLMRRCLLAMLSVILGSTALIAAPASAAAPGVVTIDVGTVTDTSIGVSWSSDGGRPTDLRRNDLAVRRGNGHPHGFVGDVDVVHRALSQHLVHHHRGRKERRGHRLERGHVDHRIAAGCGSGDARNHDWGNVAECDLLQLDGVEWWWDEHLYDVHRPSGWDDHVNWADVCTGHRSFVADELHGDGHGYELELVVEW